VLGASDVVAENELLVNTDELPDPRLLQPTSGLFVEMINQDGVSLWQSNSSTSIMPDIKKSQVGEWIFDRIENNHGQSVHRLQLSTVWEFEAGREFPFFIQAVTSGNSVDGQLRQFDRSLWFSLFISGVCLLLMQLWILSKSLKPLKTIGDELQEIEQGERNRLDSKLPTELAPLASSINTLLTSERNRHKQYRNLLDDLAHSLKTPLSVLKNMGSKASPTSAAITASAVQEQTDQMQSTVERYLQRAANSTPQTLAAAISPRTVIDRLASSLRKIYANQVTIDVNCEQDFNVRIADADLYEILGNVLDNACKYGSDKVELRMNSKSRTILIDDNGPGFPKDLITQLTQRGVRADAQVEGMGLGLAASKELIESYGGTLELSEPDEASNAASSGARVILSFS
jgi:two-component system sensor histidine kinase PhoQ